MSKSFAQIEKFGILASEMLFLHHEELMLLKLVKSALGHFFGSMIPLLYIFAAKSGKYFEYQNHIFFTIWPPY